MAPKFHFALFMVFMAFLACDNTTIEDDPIPFIAFNNIEININSIEYYDLNTKGYVLLSEGVKGIILYKNPFKTGYIAYERNCTYLPFNDNSIVEIDDSSLFMIDHSCGSKFSFEDGWPSSAPASIPLRKYRTILSGSLLIITDEPL